MTISFRTSHFLPLSGGHIFPDFLEGKREGRRDRSFLFLQLLTHIVPMGEISRLKLTFSLHELFSKMKK